MKEKKKRMANDTSNCYEVFKNIGMTYYIMY